MDGLTHIPASGQTYLNTVAPIATRQPASETPPDFEVEKHQEHPEIAKEHDYVSKQLITQANERLEFRYAKDLGQVVVKVIDSTTDTVIKELPAAELQRVHLAIRETLGMFLDRKV